MKIITRAEWGARAPREIHTVDRSLRRYTITHHSGANEKQTVRSIQNYQMDTRGWSDIGYNFLVDVAGRAYEGRGWNRLGTHTVGFNTSGIAICMIGENQDVTEAAKDAIRWLADEADRRMGRKLKRTGHRDHDNTDCPGNNLYRWVHSGMPDGPGSPIPPAERNWQKEIIAEMDVISFAGVTSEPKTWPRGPEVKTIQGVCLARGWGDPDDMVGSNGEPDGIGGPGTKLAVGEGQKKMKTGKPGAPSTPDFIFGPASWSGALLVK